MEFGAHLPIIDFDGRPWTLDRFSRYAAQARDLGYSALAVNDHFVSRRPWLDGLTALAAVLPATGAMRLVTSVALPVIRGPVDLAKMLAALDVLSGGRLVAGLGPGSSPQDYAAVGISFEERWARFDESVRAVRALLWKDRPPFRGRFYSTEGITLAPPPAQKPGLPIWIGAWGSEASLRRAARLGDGWLASAYNTTPERFAAAWRRLQEMLPALGKDADEFPNGLSTMYAYVTEDRQAVHRLVSEVLAPALNRPAEDLSDRCLFGPAEECAARLAAFRDAGLQRVFIWPVMDEERQLGIFAREIVPRVVGASRARPGG